jgi:hypothetical protein
MNHLAGASKVAVEAPEVKVIAHDMQRFAVWFGGSMLAVTRRARAHGLCLLFFVWVESSLAWECRRRRWCGFGCLKVNLPSL